MHEHDWLAERFEENRPHLRAAGWMCPLDCHVMLFPEPPILAPASAQHLSTVACVEKLALK